MGREAFDIDPEVQRFADRLFEVGLRSPESTKALLVFKEFRRTARDETPIRINADAPIPYVGPSQEFVVQVTREEVGPSDAQIRTIVAAELDRLADQDEASAAWTENNFLPGPNGDHAIRCYRDSAQRLREEANDWRAGHCDHFARAALRGGER